MIFMSKFPLFSPNFKLGFKEARIIFQFLVRSREMGYIAKEWRADFSPPSIYSKSEIRHF